MEDYNATRLALYCLSVTFRYSKGSLFRSVLIQTLNPNPSPIKPLFKGFRNNEPYGIFVFGIMNLRNNEMSPVYHGYMHYRSAVY